MEIYKLFDYNALKKIRNDLDNIEDPQKWVDEVFDKKIRERYVKEKLESIDISKLPLIDQGKSKVFAISLWNNFVQNKLNDDDKIRVENMLCMSIMNSLIFIGHCNSEESFKEQLDIFFRLDDYMTCQKTGFHHWLSIDKENGNFRVKKFKNVKIKVVDDKGNEHETYKLVEVSDLDAFRNVLYEKELYFETGKLLVADWFRDQDNSFSKVVKEDWSPERSLNHESGRVKTMNDYADKGFVSVNVGNTCPNVFYFDNKIVVGQDKEGEGYMTEGESINKGMVITDYWATTIIDESKMMNILMESGLNLIQAKNKLKEFKKECISFKVKKGKYKLTFCANYEEFNKKYRKRNKDFTKEIVPYFVLEFIGDK